MAEEEKPKKEEEVEKTEDEDKKEEEKSKTFADSIKALTDTIGKFDSDGIRKDIKDVSNKVDEFDKRIKALEEPTDLPLKPKVSAEDDIGAKTKVPDTYQSNSQQASIRDSDPKNTVESDEGKLSMQEKVAPRAIAKGAPTTETPRPFEVVEGINKYNAQQLDLSPILKAAREEGFEGLGKVGKRILKGEFYAPNQDEVATW